MSTPAPRPAPAQAALRQAGRLGRRHGKAAAYWQIGDSSGADAQPFYRDLLRGISEANQEITGLYELPDLTARQDYDRDSLAADLGLARDDPGMGRGRGYVPGRRPRGILAGGRAPRPTAPAPRPGPKGRRRRPGRPCSPRARTGGGRDPGRRRGRR